MTGDHLQIPGLLMALAVMVCGCAAMDDPADFDRHRYTDIKIPPDNPDVFYYDVTVSAEFPKDSPAAEAARNKWLTDWLKVRRMCPAGYEIVKIRPFAFEEDNAAHRDLRYEVRCKPEPPKK